MEKSSALDIEQRGMNIQPQQKDQRRLSRTQERRRSRKQSYKDQIMAEIRSHDDHRKNSTLLIFDTKETIKEKIYKFVNSTPFSIVMSVITIYALFADDVRVIATNKEADPVFWGISCFCFAAFCFEITLCSISQPDYFLGFFFWLDVMSTCSLILDIGWISNLIFQTGKKGSASSVAALAKASRASRVGTRAGRIVRVVRLVRLVRLYKHAQLAFQKQAKKFEQEQKKLMEEQRRKMENENISESAHSSNNLQQQQLVRDISGNSHNPRIASHLNTLVMIKNTSQRSKSPSQVESLDAKGQPSKSHENDRDNQSKYKTFLYKQVVDHNRSHGNTQNTQYHSNKIVPAPQDNDKKSQYSKKSKSSKQDEIEEDQIQQRQERRIPSLSRADRTSSYSQQVSLGGSSNRISSTSSDKATRLAVQTETKVGKTLSELTTKRVISIVLLIMFSMPIFSLNTYIEQPSSFQYNLQIIVKNEKSNAKLYESIIKNYIDFHTVTQFLSLLKGQRTPLIRLDIESIEYYPKGKSGVVDYVNERNDDLNYYTYTNDNGDVLATSISSSRDNNRIDAILSIVRTIFVSLVLTIASVKFTSDVEEYILEPVEKMLQKVKRISQNPLEAAQMEEKEAFAIEQLEEEGNVKELEKIKKTEGYETVVLEKLIIRVGALLALGFGEAGSEIIAKNMSQNGTVDPMLPGNKIMAVFGFCDIRNFTDATEVLQQGVMVFVNEIAQITHGIVDKYLGQANKNIGDAFLLVWKFRDQDYLKNADGTVEFLQNDITSNYADLSVISFLKIMAGITLSKNLRKYKHHPGLQKRMRGYRVKMGFGLHFGWAIEGAIGSDYKIDASYLSPNVNMASRLEAATKQFGTGLLISGPLRDILTPKCQSHLRKIDCVTVKGSIVPLDLYTADVNLERLYEKRKGRDAFDLSNFSSKQLKKKKIVDKMKRNTFKSQIMKGTIKVADEFDTDPDLKEMRKEYTKEFYDTWEKGYKLYHEGKWVEAAIYIKKTLSWFQFRQDGPSQTLYEFMRESSYVPPSNWEGFRVLTEK